MEYSAWHKINELAVAHKNMWAVYIGNGLDYEENDMIIWQYIVDQCKDMYPEEWKDIVSDLISGGLFFFDSKESMHKFYKIFDAELTDSSAIYACTYDPMGEILTDNT